MDRRPLTPRPSGHQFSCAHIPELFAAATGHHTLTTRWHNAAAIAFYDATGIFIYWRDHGILDHTHDTGLVGRLVARRF